MPKFLDLAGLQRFKSKIDTELSTVIETKMTDLNLTNEMFGSVQEEISEENNLLMEMDEQTRYTLGAIHYEISQENTLLDEIKNSIADRLEGEILV